MGPLAVPLELLAGFWRMFLELLMERRFPKGSTPFHPAVFGKKVDILPAGHSCFSKTLPLGVVGG